jgi:tetratricopeptide (TPR) repeat protein
MQPLIQMHRSFEAVVTTLVILLILGAVGRWFLRRTEDPRLLIFKWVISALVAAFWCWQAEAFKATVINVYHLIITAICAVAMIVTWRRNIANVVATPFGNLFDGGNAEIEPQPYYSVAEAKRNRGQYAEAVAEIHKQLVRFPTDYRGQLMLAEIQAEKLNDLAGAELTIQRICDQPGHAPRNIVHALTTMADWYLKYNVDAESARRFLEQIIQRFPDTEFALTAEQRMAHLGNMDKLLDPHDRRRVVVHEGIKNLGLVTERKSAEEIALAGQQSSAADYVKHLEEFPMDFEVREKLASAYADQYQRLDLATDQLEQMIAAPGQPARKITHWLNQLADLQVRHGAELATVQQTLERIVSQDPNAPAAQMARTRLGQLKLEIKGREKTLGLKMGTYEQNVGLKHGPPKQY